MLDFKNVLLVVIVVKYRNSNLETGFYNSYPSVIFVKKLWVKKSNYLKKSMSG